MGVEGDDGDMWVGMFAASASIFICIESPIAFMPKPPKRHIQ